MIMEIISEEERKKKEKTKVAVVSLGPYVINGRSPVLERTKEKIRKKKGNHVGHALFSSYPPLGESKEDYRFHGNSHPPALGCVYVTLSFGRSDAFHSVHY